MDERGRSEVLDSASRGSRAEEKLRHAQARGAVPCIAFMDIDSTLTGDDAAANAVRSRLEERGYVVVFDTSRTEEMVLSSRAYETSSVAGEFDRPRPHLGREGDRRIYVRPELVEPAGILDPDIVCGSTGSRIYVRDPDGAYRLDASYPSGQLPTRTEWRSRVLSLIDTFAAAGNGCRPADIESYAAFESGATDVFPPDYRVQLDAASEGELRGFETWLSSASRGQLGADVSTFARSLHVVDDSAPSAGRFKAFLMPRRACKARAAHRVLTGLGLVGRPCDVLFAGDSFPDLRMGLLGALSHPATLLLVGGSRLTPLVTESGESSFAGIPMSAFRRRLAAGSGGVYRFTAPCRSGGARVIVGDERYPGTEAVDTVLAFLREG